MINIEIRPDWMSRLFWRLLTIGAVVSVGFAGKQMLTAHDRSANGSPVVVSGRKSNAEVDSQTLAVIIVSSRCGACQSREFHAAEREFVTAIRQDGRVIIHGVSLDTDVAEGLSFLRKLGPFDEVSAGGGWESVAAQHYVWGELGGGEPVVPQIVIVSRIVRRLPGGVSIEEAKVHKRLIGVPEIRRFVGAETDANESP